MNYREQDRLREAAENSLKVARLLPRTERALLELYLDRRAPVTSISAIMGLSRSQVHRRISSITSRVRAYTILKLRGKASPVARDYFLLGLTLQEVARRNKTTVYRVRKTVALGRYYLREVVSR
ncbi:MAG: hypothetical protein AB7F23_06750 [Phycisphaerae bacterium]